jgi:TolB-like protein/Tfp pilus assembly protein PilF
VVNVNVVRYDRSVNDLLAELRRRNVFKAGAAYVLLAWVIAQVAELALDSFEAPGWVIKTLLLLLALGLPLVLVFAWVFEITPEGIKREQAVERSESIASQTGQKLTYLIAAAALVAIASFIWLPRNLGEEGVPADLVSQETAALVVEDAPADSRSIAVLPFVNMSADPEQQYFSDGMTEEIINSLVKIPGLSVPARTSVFAFRDHSGDIRQVGASLGVAHILEGSVRSQGDQVRITAQLIKVDDGFHLWSETFDRKLENIFAVQEEIANAIAEALLGKLGEGVNAVPNKTRNMEAYDTYLRGRAALRRRDDEAITLLEQATIADPDFAPAWAALAIAYQSVNEDDRVAMQIAQKALAIDSDNVDALNAMGAALRGTRRWLDAEPYFDRALAIDPNSAELLEDYAEFLSFVGRSEEALEITHRGMEIDARLIPLEFAHLDALVSNDLPDEALKVALQLLRENEDRGWAPWWMVPVLYNPTLEPAARGGAPLPDLAVADAPQLADLARAARSVYHEKADEGAVDLLKSFYPVPEELAETMPRFAATVAREALIYAGELDYVIDKDILWVGEQEQTPHEYNWSPFFAELRQHTRFAEYLDAAGIIAYWDSAGWPKWCARDADQQVHCR